MIDTTKMCEAVQDKNYRNIWLDGSTHYEGCEYQHYPCAMLKLCDEVDALRADIESEKKWADEYHQETVDLQAEIARLRGIIERVEKIQGYCSVCHEPISHHRKSCPLHKWKGGE